MDITPDPRAIDGDNTSGPGEAEIIPFPGVRVDRARERGSNRAWQSDRARGGNAVAAHESGAAGAGETEAPPDAEAFHDAETLVVRSLSRSAKSEHEVRSLLRTQTELSRDAQEAVVERMKAQHYLDDAQLAEDLCSGKLSRKGLGSTAMAQELRKRGLPDELIQHQLEQIEPDDELARATELATERMRRLRGVDDEAAYRRLHGFLARRGYRADVIRQAIRDAQAR